MVRDTSRHSLQTWASCSLVAMLQPLLGANTSRIRCRRSKLPSTAATSGVCVGFAPRLRTRLRFRHHNISADSSISLPPRTRSRVMVHGRGRDYQRTAASAIQSRTGHQHGWMSCKTTKNFPAGRIAGPATRAIANAIVSSWLCAPCRKPHPWLSSTLRCISLSIS